MVNLLAELLGQDALIVVLVIVVIFGASRLPKMARSLGQAKGEFEKGLKESDQSKSATESKDQP
jgi:sec-independent protein translocase protein TatA